jgi:hypothetical protein
MALSIRKPPGREILESFGAALGLFVMIRSAAFYIMNILKRRAKQLLLLLAMGAPKQPIHHRAFVCKALREPIHPLPAAQLAEVPNTGKGTSNQYDHCKFSGRRVEGTRWRR